MRRRQVGTSFCAAPHGSALEFVARSLGDPSGLQTSRRSSGVLKISCDPYGHMSTDD